MKSRKIKYAPRYIYDDYKNWEGKWELIEGLPYAMSPLPTIEHQKVSGNIYVQLLQVLKTCEKCEALLPVDWKIDDGTVVQPDNLVVCEEAKGNYITNPPVMIFEIISPSTSFKDKNIKYQIYESQSVKYYIIVDIDTKVAEVYQLENSAYQKVKDARNDTIRFQLNDDCRIGFAFENIWQL